MQDGLPGSNEKKLGNIHVHRNNYTKKNQNNLKLIYKYPIQSPVLIKHKLRCSTIYKFYFTNNG